MAFNWGFVGAGAITRRFLAGLTQVPDAIPHSVYGRTVAKAEALAEDYGFQNVFSSPDEMLDAGIDVAYVATTHPSHAEMSKIFLKAGIPVLCEKPLTPNAAQTRELIDCARKHDTFLMEALWTRTFPVSLEVRRWLRDELFGKPVGMSGNFCINFPYDPADRMYDMAAGGGAVLDIGVYLLAFVEMVFGGRADEIKAMGTFAPNGADTGVTVALRYGDRLVSLLMSFRSEANDEITIYGERGAIKVEDSFWRPRKATLQYPGGFVTAHSPIPDDVSAHDTDFSFYGEGYQNEVVHVHECLQQGLKESELMPLGASLAIAEMSDEIRSQIGLVYPFE